MRGGSRIDATTVLLGLTLAASLLLCAWGVWFGLPFLYHPDEGFEVNRALQLGTGSFDFNFFRMIKGGYFYLLFVEYGVLFVVLKLIGTVSSTQDFAMLYISDPTLFYLVGRLTTATIGTLTVYLLYRLGTRLHSRRVGLAAAIFLFANVLHVRNSHFITVDIPLTCLVTAGLLFIARVNERGRMGDYLGAGLFIALATITKLPGVLLLVPLGVVHARRSLAADGGFLGNFFSRPVLLAGAVFMLVFFAANPGALLYFHEFVLNIGRILGVVSTSGGGEGGGGNAGVLVDPPSSTLFYLRVVYEGMGLPTCAAALVGTILVVVKRQFMTGMIALFVLVFFVGISISSHPFLMYHRYLLPILPPIALLAAIAIDRLAQLLVKRIPALAPGVVAPLLALLMSLGTLSDTLASNHDFVLKDTRTAAWEWFAANVPENSRVLIRGHTAKPSKATVPLRNSEANIEAAIREFEVDGDSGKARYFRMELKAVKDKRYDLLFFGWRDPSAWNLLDTRSIDYVVVEPESIGDSIKFQFDDAGMRMLEQLRTHADYQRIATFEAGEEMRGPLIEIYGLRGTR